MAASQRGAFYARTFNRLATHWRMGSCTRRSGALARNETPKNFGHADGSGEPVRGSFKKLILPGLQQSVAPGSKEKCGELLYGGSATINEWPDEFGALTMVSFYWPEGAREPWQTWAAGIEYVDGKPYVATLVGYRWEI